MPMPATNRAPTCGIPLLALGILCGPLFAGATSAADGCSKGNLLAGALPERPAGVLHPERLTDGVAALEGDDWQVELVATVRPDAELTFDLGRTVRVRSAFLQGDHRGPYVVQGSADGAEWDGLWTTRAADGPGLRSRTTSALDHRLRFLRVINPRPHEAFGLTEIQISCDRQASPETVAFRAGTLDRTGDERERYRQQQAIHKLNVGLLGGVGFVALALARRRGRPRGLWLGLVGAAALLAYAAARAVGQPVGAERWLQYAGVTAAAFALTLTAASTLSARREGGRLARGFGVAAAIGTLGAGMYALVTGAIYGALHWLAPLAIAVLTAVITLTCRGALRPAVFRYLPLVYIALGGAFSATNFGTFYQWREVVAGIGAEAELNSATRWGPVLYHDHFHYYLGSKYFPELGYRDLYDCAALAERENGRGAAIEQSMVRNLRDNMMQPGGLALARAAECRARFSPERWQSFRRDVDYFRTRVERVAAERYLTDHGYNATPLWTAVWRPISSFTTASDRSTRWLAMLDVGFLAACLALIAWAFAPEAAALAALVWGVGQGWVYINVGGFGSFARFDWLLAVVAGVCLLRKEMRRAGGVALVAAALLRVFPGALFFGPAVRGLCELWRNRRLDVDLRRILVGGVAAAAVLVPLSMLGAGGGTYGQFAQNSLKHAETPLSNYMGLRTIFSWDAELRVRERQLADSNPDEKLQMWKEERRATLEARRVWYGLVAAGLIGLTVLLSLRSSELWLITLAGIVPMFCLFELTNYYYAIMALLAVWAYGHPRHSAVLLALALGGTIVFLHALWRPAAYLANSALVLAVLVYFLLNAIAEGRSTAAVPGSPPAAAQ
jgi:hypothetical protein